MPRVRLAAVPLLAGLLPLTAGALGLGEIALRSALNQPLVAEIPVSAESAAELDQLTVQLAPPATFERFGLDRPGFLDDLKFVVRRDGGRAIVRVTSTQPVSEPFVSLLLDVGWPQGRLLREYTVLLDPPAFARPENSAQATPSAPAAAGPVAAPQPVRRAPEPVPQPAPETARNVPAEAPTAAPSGPVGDTYGPVRSNETLWAISDRLRAEGNVSLNQMMLALYRANPEAFAGNINRLKRGAILRVPRGGELTGLTGAEAAAEVLRQEAEWRGETASAPAPAPARLQLVPPAEIPASAGPAPAVEAPPGSAPVAADRTAKLERELEENRRLLSLKDGQLKALQDRLNQLEGAPGAPVAMPLPDGTTADAEVDTATLPDAELVPDVPAAEQPETSAVAPDDVAPSQARNRDAEGGSFLDSLGGLVFNAWFLVSAAVVLLAGLFFVFTRRRLASDEAVGRFTNDLRGGMVGGAAGTAPASREGYSVEEDDGDRTQSAPIMGRPSPRESVDTDTVLERTISTEGAVELDQADVVAEADFHMAYGLYDQAAQLLTRALRDAPDRRHLRLKLLEVYFIWENKGAFLKEAQIFQRQTRGTADPDWNKVVIMGKQICPGEALFAGAVGATGAAGLDLALNDDDQDAHSSTGVDFAFDDGPEEGLDLDLTAARQGPPAQGLDFDPGADTGMMPMAVAPGLRGSAEVPAADADFPDGDYSPTMETPTIESRGLDVPTVETPTIETAAAGTVETPTLESAAPGRRAGASDRLGNADGPDNTEEINLEDLGLDLTGLDEAAGELGTGVHADLEGALDEALDTEERGAEPGDLLEGLEGDSTAEMRGMALDEGTLDLPAFGAALEKSAAGRDSSVETAAHRAIDDTAEQPGRFGRAGGQLGEQSGELSQVDFDIGAEPVEDLEPTSVMTGKRRRGPEGPTMTEVGTKLDLARAYVDMGDPDGARSILNEVLEEGDSAQRQEARKLLDDLAD